MIAILLRKKNIKENAHAAMECSFFTNYEVVKMGKTLYDANCSNCDHEWETTLIEITHYTESGCPRCGSNNWTCADD